MSIATLREHRISGIAIFDLVGSFALIIIIALILRNKYWPNLKSSDFILAAIIITLPISIFAHMLFGINTTLNYKLGLSDKPVK